MTGPIRPGAVIEQARSATHAEGEAGGGSETWRAAALVTMACAVLLLVPLAFFEHFPSTDGPAHLETATILREYSQPDREVTREFHRPDLRPMPNWFGTAALIVLTAVAPPLVAEKLLVAAYVLGLPLAMLYLLIGINRRSAFLAALSLPLIYGYVLYMGFYSFLFGVVFLLLLLGWWWRRRDTLGWRHLPALTALSLLVYFSHPIATVLAWAIVLGLSGWLVLLDLSARKVELKLGAALRRRMVLPLLAFAPSVALLVFFLSQSGAGTWERAPLEMMVRRLFTLEVMRVHHARETPISLLMSAVVGLLLLRVVRQNFVRWRRWQPTQNDGWVLVGLGCVLVYFLTPEVMAGGSLIVRRMILLTGLMGLPVLAIGVYPAALRWGVTAAGGGLAMGLLVLQLPVWEQTNIARREYLSAAAHIEPFSTLAPVFTLSHDLHPEGWTLSSYAQPLVHAGSLLAIERKAINLHSYQPSTRHFPITFQGGVNHFDLLYRKGVPRKLDLAAYRESTGLVPRYLVLWCTSEQLVEHERYFAEFGYRRTFTSEDPGYVHLLERQSESWSD